VVILSDITTLKQMEGDIEVLNTNLSERALQLEILNKELEAFNYSVSHDLRAPLTNVMGYSQVLLDIFKEHLPPQCQEIVQGIANQANRMNRLIEALLNLSHISHGELNRQSVDLGEIASGILKGLKANTPERQALFEIAPEMNSNGDLELIYILLNNLIGNAWKYTGRNDSTRIKVGREEQEGKQVFFVRDNGVGFDMEQVGKLFDTFQRLHNRDDFDGNGIGLATAQRIVQRHGGKIWAEGVVDKGATFYFTLD
jgi:light-regulated signal transduction histidine kinase (bacteriophytochrome)